MNEARIRLQNNNLPPLPFYQPLIEPQGASNSRALHLLLADDIMTRYSAPVHSHRFAAMVKPTLRPQRAAVAAQAVGRALARVHEHAPRAGLIAARRARQAMVNAGLGDQRVEVAVQAAARRLVIFERLWQRELRHLQCPVAACIFDQPLHVVVARAREVELWRDPHALKQPPRVGIDHEDRLPGGV